MFEVKDYHLRLLEHSYITWNPGPYEGSPALDAKRPFGNSNVNRDIQEICFGVPEGVSEEDFWEDFYDDEKLHERAEKIYLEMEHVVQIAINLAGKGQLITPGVYVKPDRYCSRNWVRKD